MDRKLLPTVLHLDDASEKDGSRRTKYLFRVLSWTRTSFDILAQYY